ncbi:MAG TPA: hypothetical protein VE641_08780, partial [Chthoniobacterales bacterium]|nr:hypothetical protein [Chthoniobacterales bacterium]
MPQSEVLSNALGSNLGLLSWPAAKGPLKSELNSQTQIVLQAFRYSAIKHGQQTLADGVTPYFVHVVRVCWILRDLFQIKDTA